VRQGDGEVTKPFRQRHDGGPERVGGGPEDAAGPPVEGVGAPAWAGDLVNPAGGGSGELCVAGAHREGSWSSGLTGAPFCRISKWLCGGVVRALPVCPTVPIRWPCLTCWPRVTSTVCMWAERVC